MLQKILTKIFGSKQDKDVKELQPIVDEINEMYEQLNGLSDDEIKAKTDEFRKLIKDRTQELDSELEGIRNRLKTEALEFNEIEDLSDRAKKLDEEIHEETEDVLAEILPEAFAVVKQACRRLKDNEFSYEYAGQQSKWEMVPYDVQLMGGVVLHQGKISEMATGEGKTLVAVLPLYLNALPGKGVHLVTVNDYLAKRDSEWMGPVYEFLGLSVGAIQSNMNNDQRKKMYNLDITYGTNNEFGFDYLRDNMVVDMEQMVQRPHWYSIVDEVDSVLIDEARTPLIISGPVGQSDQKFDEMKPRVHKLVQAQTRLVNEIVSDAEKYLKSDKKEDLDQAGICLLRAQHGLPKQKRLMKLLQEPDNQKLLRETEMFFLREKAKRMHEIDDELYYVIEEKQHSIDITEKGRELMATAQEDKDMFVIPDIATEMSELEGDESISEAEKTIRKDQLYLLFAERSDRIHTISQLLRAYSLYEKDVEYVIQDNKIMIVDEHTGRILEGRRYSEGLHQAIEAKEGVKVERDTQTLATITLQNYFRLYNKLAGMTGTAETEAGEFDNIYKLDVVVIPTNRPIQRDDRNDFIYRTIREKYNAVVEEVEAELKKGRAILVGTATVEVSELLSKMLRRKGIKHNVLNAKHHAKEAEIVTQAGRKGAVTIATNMAGRGTDIKLDHDVKKNGGLAIIGSERHDSRRIDRQLRGRAGRQGDPGSSVFFISLEDKLMRLFGGDRMAGIMSKLKIPEGEPIQHSMMTKTVENAQKKVEENNFGIRKRLLDYDDVMNTQRETIYRLRRQALRGDRLRGKLFDDIDALAEMWYQEYHPTKDVIELQNQVRSHLLSDIELTEEEFEQIKMHKVMTMVHQAADKFYSRKEEMLGSEFMARLERIASLETIDSKWREHLREMDELKEGIHLRSYAQKNPITEYKREASGMFSDLLFDISTETIKFAFKYFPKIVDANGNPVDITKIKEQAPTELPRRRTSTPSQSSMSFSHDQTPEFIRENKQARDGASAGGKRQKVATIRREAPKVGRNDLCPCGSGKKYKKCCGKVTTPQQ